VTDNQFTRLEEIDAMTDSEKPTDPSLPSLERLEVERLKVERLKVELLEELRVPLRKLLVIARYFHKEKREDIFQQFTRSNNNNKNITTINNLVDVAKHPDIGKRDLSLLRDLYVYIYSYYSNRALRSEHIDDLALPLLRICFPDRMSHLPSNPFEFLYSHITKDAIKQLCDQYHGVYEYVRLATKAEAPSGGTALVRGRIIIRQWAPTMRAPSYTHVYRGRNNLGWYTRNTNGNICLTGHRLLFVGQEEERLQLSHMIWSAQGFAMGNFSRRAPESPFHAGVTAADSAGQVFSAVAVCRRISDYVPNAAEEIEKLVPIGIVKWPSSEEWAKQIVNDKYLNPAKRELYMLELGLT